MRQPTALILVFSALGMAGLTAGPTSATADLKAGATRPSLVVVLVVDQMRADYVDRYGHHWSAGLKRIVDEGARFTEAAYPYLNTVTCPGHATIGTGRFPARHGMILNEWWNRETGRQQSCTADPAAKTLTPTGGLAGGGHSAVWLLAPTLADTLAAQEGRIVSLSLKARSAVMMAGRGADLITWYDESEGFVTSSAFVAALPPFASAYLRRRPIEERRGVVWTKLLADMRYLGPDDGAYERPGPGWTRSFPHALDADGPRFYRQWGRTPFADEYVAALAMEAIDELKLGGDERTDFLGVGFATLDSAGHGFGPDSHEVQDVLARLDRTIGRLLAHLDRRVGRDRYTLALSADHGVAPIPEQAKKDGLDAGRIQPGQIADRVNETLVRALGPGRYVAAMLYTDLYFAPGVWSKLTEQPETLRAAIETLAAQPGVLRVFRGDELISATDDPDPIKRAAALSHHPGRSGDLIMVPKPYWLTSPDATTHGTLHPYDRRVPLVLYGAGVRPGVYTQPATPADIAPTLAFLAGVTLNDPDGRPLVAALGRAVTVTAKPSHP